MSRILIQIVPGLPPATNGVGDYALALACAMRRECELETLFVIGNDVWEGPEEIEGFRVQKLATRTARNIEDTLDAAHRQTCLSGVLLQLSGYGYSRRGCPFWLLQGLKRWRKKQPDAQLVTMFHELYAFGPPWRSVFWLNPAQRMVVTSIARLSDIAVTNLQTHRIHLEHLDSSKCGRIPVLAIPSGVGEPVESVDLSARSMSMVVFGQPPLRGLTYKTQMVALQQACQQLGIREVYDVGKSFDGIPDRVGNVPVKKYGLLSAPDLSSILSRSFAGFITYPQAFLAKSSVFGSYCAHRLIPVVPLLPGRSQNEADGIQCGIHFHSVGGKQKTELQLRDAQLIADAAWNWYQGHSLQRLARAYARLLLN